MGEREQGPAGVREPESDGSAPGPGAAEPSDSSAPERLSGVRVCEVTLDEFEGPLDLLLHLVRRHELDILDIPIAFVCEKYLEYIDFMQAMELEVAGDYLVMASTLAYLKSRELVPQAEPDAEEGVTSEDEGSDPREQLIRRLLEYQTFKDAASRLDLRPMAGRDTFGRGQDVQLPPVDAGLAPITLFRLADAYNRVLERVRIHKSHEVVMETISVAHRMEQLTARLIDDRQFEFEGLFTERRWGSVAELRSMLVVTLMSILELVRMGVARVRQPIGLQAIVVERVVSAAEAREALRDYDESLSFGDGPSSSPANPEVPGPPVPSLIDDAPPPSPEVDGASDRGKPSAQVTEWSTPRRKLEPTDGEEPLASALDESSAGAMSRSVVSEPPSSDTTVVDSTLGAADGDGHEYGENGEGKTEAIEGS